jgi:hypothetical protein
VFDQAENRLHAQKALLLKLITRTLWIQRSVLHITPTPVYKPNGKDATLVVYSCWPEYPLEWLCGIVSIHA